MASIRIQLTTPAGDNRPVFIAGSFCDWYPDVEAFRLQPVGAGRYAIDLPADLLAHGPLEYKYTRGGWDSVELTAAGETAPNRLFQRPGGTQHDRVPHWRWHGQAFNPAFMPQVRLISNAFDAPQLNTTRRIQVLLPHDYDHASERYPVLYLNDGQNLFGEGSAYGNWTIDQKLAILAHRHHHRLIVVSIDHGESERVAEFLPYNTRLADGRGHQYLQFVVETLKPFIDAQYRTLPNREQTGIGGSSMGGLITLYAGLLHPRTFGRLMIFSPSLWASPKVYSDALRFYSPTLTKVYLYGGKAESAYMVPHIKRLRESLTQRDGDAQTLRIELSIDPKGQHNETRWGQEFAPALEWLFFD